MGMSMSGLTLYVLLSRLHCPLSEAVLSYMFMSCRMFSGVMMAG